MSEFEDAVRLAIKVLDTPYRDPDDDLSMMSRRFTRACEREQKLAAELLRLKFAYEATSPDPGSKPQPEKAHDPAPERTAYAMWHLLHSHKNDALMMPTRERAFIDGYMIGAAETRGRLEGLLSAAVQHRTFPTGQTLQNLIGQAVAYASDNPE